MSDLYIGLMSGTSLDGIDAVLVDFSQSLPKLVASHYAAFNPELRQSILSLCHPGLDEINRLGELDVILGQQFAEAVLTLLKNNNILPSAIRAIGSHGQTIRHHPQRKHPFTLQVGDPNVIAALTKITTVADFRRRDIALGGQGAPLVPAFHRAIFAGEKERVILNIGGIANVTFLVNQRVWGFDSGPGNTLLDAWTQKNLGLPHDTHGEWASKGCVDQILLPALLSDAFFNLLPPKSSGREYFNLEWLQGAINQLNYLPKPIHIQATLVELTAISILDSISKQIPQGEIYVCGGGVHNQFLMERLRVLGNHFSIYTTEKLGIHPDWVEAFAFAWLAKQTLENKPGNIPDVTGAHHASLLGGVYYT